MLAVCVFSQLSIHFLFGCFREGCGDVLSAPFQGGGYWGQIQLMWASPAHYRTLTDGSGCHTGANCTSGAILGFSVLLKDTSICSSVPPQGSQDSRLGYSGYSPHCRLCKGVGMILRLVGTQKCSKSALLKVEVFFH